MVHMDKMADVMNSVEFVPFIVGLVIATFLQLAFLFSIGWVCYWILL